MIEEKYSSHSQTLKINEDLQVFKNATITSKNCSDHDNSSKRMMKELAKKKTKNLAMTLSEYFLKQKKLIKNIRESAILKLECIPKAQLKTRLLALFSKFYFSIMVPLSYFLGGLNFFLINESRKENNSVNIKIISAFEGFYLSIFFLEILLKIKNHRNFTKGSFYLSLAQDFFFFFIYLMSSFLNTSQQVFLGLNLFRIWRIYRIFHIFNQYFFERHENTLPRMGQKNISYFPQMLFELIMEHVLYIIFWANFASIFIFILEDYDDFYDVLNVFAHLSRFSNPGPQKFYSVESSRTLSIFLLFYFSGLVFIFLHSLINLSLSKKSSFSSVSSRQNLVVVFGDYDIKKLMFCMRLNVDKLNDQNYLLIVPQTDSRSQEVTREFTSEGVFSRFIEEKTLKKECELQDLLIGCKKVFIFDDDKRRYSHNLQLFENSIKCDKIFFYQEHTDRMKLYQEFSRMRIINIKDLELHIWALNLQFPRIYEFFFDLFGIHRLPSETRPTNRKIQTGKAKISALIEKIKFGDIFRILFFCSFEEKENAGEPLILLGVFHQNEFIKENLFSYALQPNDELFFMSQSIEKHRNLIENFSSKDLTNFRGIEEVMSKILVSSLRIYDLSREKKIENIFCLDTDKKFLESLLLQSSNLKAIYDHKLSKSSNNDHLVSINLFNKEKKQLKRLQMYEDHIILFMNDQAKAVQLIQILRWICEATVFIFVEAAIDHKIWSRIRHFFKGIVCFYGNAKRKGHLKCLRVKKASKIFIHRSMNQIPGSDYESLFLAKLLRESFFCKYIFLDLVSNIEVAKFIEINDLANCAARSMRISKIIDSISSYSFYDYFFKCSSNEILEKFFQYFLIHEGHDSMIFFKIKINEQLCNCFPDMASLIWKILQLRIGFPFKRIPRHSTMHSKSSKIDLGFDLKEKLCINDEIIFYSTKLEGEFLDLLDESKTTKNAINLSGVNTKEENERKILTLSKGSKFEEKYQEHEINENENRMEFCLSDGMIKEKILLKEHLINSLKFSIKVYDEYCFEEIK